GNIFGALEKTADVDSRTGGAYRSKRAGLCEFVIRYINSQPFCQFNGLGCRLHTYRENNHIELFCKLLSGLISVLDRHVVAVGNGVHRVHTRTDEPNSILVPRPVVIFLEVLAVSAHVHIENGGVEAVRTMLLGYHRLLYGVHAANARAVRMGAVLTISGSHALYPGYLFRLLV